MRRYGYDEVRSVRAAPRAKTRGPSNRSGDSAATAVAAAGAAARATRQPGSSVQQQQQSQNLFAPTTIGTMQAQDRAQKTGQRSPECGAHDGGGRDNRLSWAQMPGTRVRERGSSSHLSPGPCHSGGRSSSESPAPAPAAAGEGRMDLFSMKSGKQPISSANIARPWLCMQKLPVLERIGLLRPAGLSRNAHALVAEGEVSVVEEGMRW